MGGTPEQPANRKMTTEEAKRAPYPIPSERDLQTHEEMRRLDRQVMGAVPGEDVGQAILRELVAMRQELAGFRESFEQAREVSGR